LVNDCAKAQRKWLTGRWSIGTDAPVAMQEPSEQRKLNSAAEDVAAEFAEVPIIPFHRGRCAHCDQGFGRSTGPPAPGRRKAVLEESTVHSRRFPKISHA
jgi:hypothetical protein